MLDLSTAIGEARELHQGKSSRNWLAIFSKPQPGVADAADSVVRRGKQHLFRLEDLDAVVGAVRSAPDTYISQSSFAYRSRKTNAVASMGCAFVDIDCYNLKIIPDEHFVRDLIERAADAGLPPPSYATYSGRGIYLKWLFTKPVPATQIHRWEALQNVLVPLFRAVGSDPRAKDAARVLRVMGSTNSVTNMAVSLMWQGRERRHDFDELCAAACAVDLSEMGIEASREISKIERRIRKMEAGDPATLKDRRAAAEAAIEHLKSFTAKRSPDLLDPRLNRMSVLGLNWRRFLDLRDLTIRRGGPARGSRDLTLFWMSTFLAHSGIIQPQNFMAEVSDLATAFEAKDFRPIEAGYLTTLQQRVIDHRRGKRVEFMGQVYSPIYTATNETLINLFEIEEDEQRELATIIGPAERQRRADEFEPGRAERRRERLRWQGLARQMAEEAAKSGSPAQVNTIAKVAGVHKSQVSRFLARIGLSPKPAGKTGLGDMAGNSKPVDQVGQSDQAAPTQPATPGTPVTTNNRRGADWGQTLPAAGVWDRCMPAKAAIAKRVSRMGQAIRNLVGVDPPGVDPGSGLVSFGSFGRPGGVAVFPVTNEFGGSKPAQGIEPVSGLRGSELNEQGGISAAAPKNSKTVLDPKTRRELEELQDRLKREAAEMKAQHELALQRARDLHQTEVMQQQLKVFQQLEDIRRQAASGQWVKPQVCGSSHRPSALPHVSILEEAAQEARKQLGMALKRLRCSETKSGAGLDAVCPTDRRKPQHESQEHESQGFAAARATTVARQTEKSEAHALNKERLRAEARALCEGMRSTLVAAGKLRPSSASSGIASHGRRVEHPDKPLRGKVKGPSR